jgi:hypothetical protein
MRQLVSKCPQFFLILLLAPLNLCLAQQGAVASLRSPNGSNAGNSPGREFVPPAEQEAILARFVAAETKVREALNQHTFKRDVVLQTIGPNGEVTGEYIRNSQFIFDDRGRRIERVIFHPSSTIREMRITKEDIQDLKDGQLLGIDIVEATKYRLAYAGVETVNNRQLFAVDVAPLTQPDPNRMKERYFVGRVWVDPQTFQIVMIKGIMEPQGKQRFPMFMTWREPVKEALAFPTRTEADDILHFKERDVHYRIKVRYYDYKEFGSRVNITDVDESDAQLEETKPETKGNPGKREPSFKSSETPIRLTTSTSDRTSKSEMCTINRTAPPVGEYHWPADSEVKVYFVRSMFNPEQTAVMLEAMKTWNIVGADNGSGVRFSYGGETDSRMSCRNCLTVTRKDVFARDKHHYAFFHPMKQEEGRLLVSAWIDLDFHITDPTALQGFMAHEMGHGLGLWDCPSCKKKRSLMNSFPGINKNNGLVAPSSCDVATMRGVYQQERQLAMAMRRDDKPADLKPAASALALPTRGLEKAGSFAFDSLRPFAAGAAAARNVVDSGAKTAPVERVFAPTPRGLELQSLKPFGLQSPQVYKSLFSGDRIF